jgi:hypothetical protein
MFSSALQLWGKASFVQAGDPGMHACITEVGLGWMVDGGLFAGLCNEMARYCTGLDVDVRLA